MTVVQVKTSVERAYAAFLFGKLTAAEYVQKVDYILNNK